MKTKNYIKAILLLVFSMVFLYGCREKLGKIITVQKKIESILVIKRKDKKYLDSFIELSQKVDFLKKAFNKNSIQGKDVINGAYIFTDFYDEVEYNGFTYSNFEILRTGKSHYREKLVIVSKDGIPLKKYIFRHKKIGLFDYDKTSFETLEIKENQYGDSKFIISSTTFVRNCTQYNILRFDCNKKEHHHNGAWCQNLSKYTPLDEVTLTNICKDTSISGSGTTDLSTKDNGGNNYQIPSDATIITIPSVPSSYVKKFGNPLQLTDTQINYLNSNNDLRQMLYTYLSTKGVYRGDTENNGIYEITQNLIDFSKFTIDFFEKNSDSSEVTTENWAKFQNWYLGKSEGKEGGNYDSNYWENPNLQFPPQNLPLWQDYYDAYPHHSDGTLMSADEVYTLVGGVMMRYHFSPKLSISSNWQNACAIRVSRALNYSGVIIPKVPGTLKGGDGKNYFIRAKELNLWMRKTFGTSPSNQFHHNFTKFDGGINGQNFPNLLAGLKGIFSIVAPVGSTLASGHADCLQPNGTCVNSCHFYDGDIEYIDLWELN